MKAFKRVGICFLVTVLLMMGVVAGGTYYYLKEYGYTIYALPKALAVCLGFSDGYTIYDIPESETTVFIGKSRGDYNWFFQSRGYDEVERFGTVAYYKKQDSTKEAYDFAVWSSDDWCWFFRLYRIGKGYRIEDFK
ncbi:MAG: hypothetical protein J6A61_04960 [Clostridia bacterium]|nr:hypothetical protein [Clostridia bacterium]